jgi:hypothetical protein
VGEDVHQLAVYPNPAKEILNIEIQSTEVMQAEIQLQSIDGRIVYQGIIDLNTTRMNHNINVSEFNSGMYILLVRGQDLLYRKKIVIE